MSCVALPALLLAGDGGDAAVLALGILLGAGFVQAVAQTGDCDVAIRLFIKEANGADFDWSGGVALTGFEEQAPGRELVGMAAGEVLKVVCVLLHAA